MRERLRHRARGQRHVLRSQQALHDLAKGPRRAVREEVGLARLALLSGLVEPLAAVLHMAGRGQIPAAANPLERAVPGALDQLRQQRRVAAAPDEARPHDDGVLTGRDGLAHALLGGALGACVNAERRLWQRPRLIDLHQRCAVDQHGLGADVDEAAHARLPGRLQHLHGAVDGGGPRLFLGAPVLGEGRGVKDDVAAAHAFGHRGAAREVALDAGGARGLDSRQRRCRPPQGPHRHAALHQIGNEVAPHKARTARDECRLHARSVFQFRFRTRNSF